MSEQLKDVLNRVRLVGKLAEVTRFTILDTVKGPAASFKGVIQFGETSAETRNFEGFINKFNKDGKENVNFQRAIDLIQNGTPMTKSKENATELVLDGQIDCNDYVGADGKIKQTIALKISFIRTKETGDNYEARIQIEGYILNIADELSGSGEDVLPTGRKKLNLISANYRNEAIDLKGLILKQETLEGFRAQKKEDFEDVYSQGKTAKFTLKYLPSERRKAPQVTDSGFGEQVVTEGTNYVELVIVGSPETPEEVGKFSFDLVRNLQSERKIKLAELEEKGYQGGKKTNNTISSANLQPVQNPEDIPF